jgi:N-ethylmaleimide reductase
VIVPRARDLGGFEVRRALPSTNRQMVGPSIFFDQMGPAEFMVGEGIDVRPHPHINLATVTYLFDGEIMHRGSLGTAVPIGELDAGRGMLTAAFAERLFAATTESLLICRCRRRRLSKPRGATMAQHQSIDLFTPIRVGQLPLNNRIVMAPLTRSRAGPGNVPTRLNALYYAQRASAGLIISEATQIAPEGQGYIATPGIHSHEQIEGWKCVTKAVHVANGHIVLQLWHVGRISHSSFQPGGVAPVAPSAIQPKGQAFTAKGFEPIPTPRALETEEIPRLVEKYAQAARNAISAGFDGVEVHGANGYLIDQFLQGRTNQRTDQYGGSIENRSRFLMEVVDAVSAAVGVEHTGVRISPQNRMNDIADGDPQALFDYVAEHLSGKRLAYLHIIEGDTSGAAVPAFDYMKLKRLFGGFVIANNGFNKELANKALTEGSADLIAFGIPFIANPDLVVRLFLDAPLVPVNRETLYGGGEQGYTDYPFLRSVAPHACYHDTKRAWG